MAKAASNARGTEVKSRSRKIQYSGHINGFERNPATTAGRRFRSRKMRESSIETENGRAQGPAVTPANFC
jgi:hypothetical protein